MRPHVGAVVCAIGLIGCGERRATTDAEPPTCPKPPSLGRVTDLEGVLDARCLPGSRTVLRSVHKCGYLRLPVGEIESWSCDLAAGLRADWDVQSGELYDFSLWAETPDVARVSLDFISPLVTSGQREQLATRIDEHLARVPVEMTTWIVGDVEVRLWIPLDGEQAGDWVASFARIQPPEHRR